MLVRIVLQPIVDLATGAVVGAEALARFPNPSGVREMPVAEQFALAHSHGRGSELEAACLREALGRRAHLPAHQWLSANVSPDALGHPAVRDALAGDLDRMVIEITEHPVSDRRLALSVIDDLRARGALIAVDDASTGYAGLLRLSGIRPDIVKLDAGLVTGAGDSAEKSVVIETLVSLSHRLGALVIGEGVETIDDLHALIELDVDYAQGWALGRPSNEMAAIDPAATAVCRAARRAIMRREIPDDDMAHGLRRVTATLAGSVDIARISESLRHAADGLGVDDVGLYTLVGSELREITTADVVRDSPSYPLPACPAAREALASQRMIEIHHNLPTSDGAAGAPQRFHGFASKLVAPLIPGGAPLGVLELRRRTTRRWTSHDIRRAHMLADHVALALERSTRREPRSAAHDWSRW